MEPVAAKLIGPVLERLVVAQTFRILLEAAASEHGARMTAMDSATKNAKEVIRKLTLQYNRGRQAAITKELIEITSGAEAL
jgi:F-type H+-transporting ATPase subunit gamma